jgi:hypothetical protein
MKKFILQKLLKSAQILGFNPIEMNLNVLKKVAIETYLEQKLQQIKYSNPLNLNRFEYQVLSQNGEDGIIYEIFSRIGTDSKFFVEFGVGNGTENNSAYLLLQNWEGIWIEGSKEYCDSMKLGYSDIIKDGKLQIKESFITKENIVKLFEESKVPTNLDFLSIDIDGNDYWVWEALGKYKPRVVAIEYNASLGPHIEWVMPYNENHVWNGTEKGHYFGASLKSFEILGRKLGYSLVGCNLTGANAFFVRNDLVNETLFAMPFTSGNHYERPVYFLEKQLGHKRNHQLVNSIVKGK